MRSTRLKVLAVMAILVVGGAGLALGVRACLIVRSGSAAGRKAGAIAVAPTFFARVKGTRLLLALPARPPELIGIGFHQASNPRSSEMIPTMRWLARDDNTQAARLVRESAGTQVVMFRMHSRGRGTGLDTAADVVVKPRTLVVSPVTGVVTLITPYRLYGRYPDIRVEIAPDGYPRLRVAAIHIKDLAIKEGDRVTTGLTALGRPRRFSFDAQVDRYVGGRVEHVHFQVNPYPPIRY